MSVCRFILSDDEVTPAVEDEMASFGDIVLVHGETTYKSILLKSIFVLEYAVTHYDVRFVLKTDDDAYVNVRYLVRATATHALAMTHQVLQPGELPVAVADKRSRRPEMPAQGTS